MRCFLSDILIAWQTGETALMFAARHGDKKTAERLIQAKADLLLEDSVSQKDFPDILFVHETE